MSQILSKGFEQIIAQKIAQVLNADQTPEINKNLSSQTATTKEIPDQTT